MSGVSEVAEGLRAPVQARTGLQGFSGGRQGCENSGGHGHRACGFHLGSLEPVFFRTASPASATMARKTTPQGMSPGVSSPAQSTGSADQKAGFFLAGFFLDTIKTLLACSVQIFLEF